MAKMKITLEQLKMVLQTEPVKYPITFGKGVNKQDAHAILKNSNKKKV